MIEMPSKINLQKSENVKLFGVALPLGPNRHSFWGMTFYEEICLSILTVAAMVLKLLQTLRRIFGWAMLLALPPMFWILESLGFLNFESNPRGFELSELNLYNMASVVFYEIVSLYPPAMAVLATLNGILCERLHSKLSKFVAIAGWVLCLLSYLNAAVTVGESAPWWTRIPLAFLPPAIARLSGIKRKFLP